MKKLNYGFKTQMSLLNLRNELNCDDIKQREIYFKINSCLFSDYPLNDQNNFDENYSYLEVFEATEKLHNIIFETPNLPLKRADFLSFGIKDVLLEVMLNPTNFIEYTNEIELLKCAYDQLKKEGKIGYNV